MDYDLSEIQQSLLDTVTNVVQGSGGVERAQAVSRDAGYDEELDTALRERVDLSGTGMLERVLVAEQLAEFGTATTFGLRAVLESEIELPAGAVVVADRHRSGPVRYGPAATTLLLLDGDTASLVELPAGRTSTIRSSYGFPYARLDREQLAGAECPVDGTRLRSLWRLATSAEIAGNASAATKHTAEHLRTRQQFGQPLAFFQALRHRLADAAVTAEATRWMVRDAAFADENRAFDLAAAYAADCAARLVPELVQLCGARSFTIAFGLQAYAMRLAGLRLELGGADHLAAAVLAHADAGVGVDA
jgi:hypothetical protein